MSPSYKNKTVATLFAALTGGLGMHRFYLYNKKDVWGWLHLTSVPLTLALRLLAPSQPWLFVAAPLAISILTAFIEALVIGLTPDDKWNATHNPSSERHAESGWPLAMILVFTVGVGAIALIATIARTFDLLFTGGAYG